MHHQRAAAMLPPCASCSRFSPSSPPAARPRRSPAPPSPTRSSTRTFPTPPSSGPRTAITTPTPPRPSGTTGGSTFRSRAPATSSNGSFSATLSPPSRPGRARPRISGRRTSPSIAAFITSIIRPSRTRPWPTTRRACASPSPPPTGRKVHRHCRPLLCGPARQQIPMSDDDPATGKRCSTGAPASGRQVQDWRPTAVFAPERAHRSHPRGPRIRLSQARRRRLDRAFAAVYYLLLGYNCCGKACLLTCGTLESAPARSSFSGAPCSSRDGKWIGPGHNSVIDDDRGESWLVYHAVDAARPRTKPTDEVNTRRVMLIDHLVWTNEWPRVKGPTSGPQRRRYPERYARD